MDENMTGFEEEILEAIPEEEPQIVRSFATVGAVYEDGVSLIFDGESAPTEKHYLCNTNVYFSAGDRVRILEDSGTYVVEYVVGPPRQSRLVGIPAGGAQAQVLTKTSGADYASDWADVPHELPSGGSNGQILEKDGANNYAVKWGAAPEGLPSGGSTGQVVTKTATGAAWQAVPAEIPASGTTGYVLTKQSSGFGWAAAPHELPSGGTNGQVLEKDGSTDYSVKWASAPHELPSGGTNGQVLAKDGSTNYAVKWAAAPAGVPSGGSSGQVLTKTSSSYGWSAIPPAAKIRNPASSSYPESDSYIIQFRTKNYYGSDAGVLQFRMGTSGTWISLANA